MGLLNLLGRQSMTMDSANLWFRPPTSYSVACEHAGAFGTVCKPIGIDAEKTGNLLDPPGGVKKVYNIKMRASFKRNPRVVLGACFGRFCD